LSWPFLLEYFSTVSVYARQPNIAVKMTRIHREFQRRARRYRHILDVESGYCNMARQ
ncbi:hypothetical protein NDU88_003727, partial [Pleurodeles waltl]